MTSLKDRQRAAARAKLEREMALRQEHAEHRRRRTWVGVASALAVVVVVVGIVVIVSATGGKPKTKAPAVAAAAGPATCTWTPNPNPSASPSPTASTPVNKYLVKTGTPPTTGIPHAGTRTMTLNSNLGPVTIALNLAKAPCASESMTFLSGKKFYDNTGCGDMAVGGPYVLLCGDPSNTGAGGPNYSYTPENLPPAGAQPNYQLGDVVMLNAGAGNGSQFLFVYKDTPLQADPSTGAENSLIPSNYTIVGTVTSGMDIIQKVAAGGTAKADPKTGYTPPKVPIKFTTVTVGPVTGS